MIDLRAQAEAARREAHDYLDMAADLAAEQGQRSLTGHPVAHSTLDRALAAAERVARWEQANRSYELCEQVPINPVGIHLGVLDKERDRLRAAAESIKEGGDAN